jgi:hypothetical protein
MDSVIILFGNASFEEVEHEALSHGFSNGAVRRGDEAFQLQRYSYETMRAEYEPDELLAIHKVLKADAKSAFQVACRHGTNARFAIQVVNALLSRFKPSVLDDDFGSLWLPEEVAARAASNPEKGIFALRADA